MCAQTLARWTPIKTSIASESVLFGKLGNTVWKKTSLLLRSFPQIWYILGGGQRACLSGLGQSLNSGCRSGAVSRSSPGWVLRTLREGGPVGYGCRPRLRVIQKASLQSLKPWGSRVRISVGAKTESLPLAFFFPSPFLEFGISWSRLRCHHKVKEFLTEAGSGPSQAVFPLG